ncbi:MAG: hypothetical protein N2487_01700 [Verrucomicrobiae bacterium]|nr:hypothetical protein [Verrucomicrobiae bacterium]
MKWVKFKGKLSVPAMRAMMLAPMLCFVGCAGTAKIYPSIQASPGGNAVIATLPTGCEIRIKENAERVAQAFANEVEIISTNSGGALVLKTIRAVKIATEGYIAERDQREVGYIEEILNLKMLLQDCVQTKQTGGGYGK